MTWEYSSAPEGAQVALRESYGLFIDGNFVEPSDGATFATLNPANEQVLAEVATAGERDIDLAVAAARRAYEGAWGATRPADRAKYLYRIARLIQERARELAVLETLDNGKPIRESRDIDVPLVARHFYHHAGWASLIADEFPGDRKSVV